MALFSNCLRIPTDRRLLWHPDSHGYRPGRSALDSVAQARRRCWRQDWVLDLDSRAFFDAPSHCPFRCWCQVEEARIRPIHLDSRQGEGDPARVTDLAAAG